MSMLSGMRERRAKQHYGEGIRLAKLGHHDEALESLNQVIDLIPEYQGVYYWRGFVLARLGRHEEALDAFDQILAAEPQHAVAHFNRAVILTDLGRTSEALAAYDQALAISPDQSHFHLGKGKTLVAAGDLDGARGEFETAAELRPERSGVAEAWIAAVLWHQGDPDAGERALRAAARENMSPKDLGHLRELLSDPPLPGLDRLRAAADGI